MKVLVVDDDLALADVVTFTMRRAGYEVITAHDGEAALEAWERDTPDLILLDLNLPRLDGLAVCRRIRSSGATPLIILSVRGEEDDVVKGLELGADDYIVKPFSPRQLVARAEAVLRRAKSSRVPRGAIKAGDLELDPARMLALRQGEPLPQLTRLETRLLETLMLNAGQVVPTDSLIDAVWGASKADRIMLKQLVYRLRRKIEPSPSDPGVLVTVPGLGYTFETG
jgi:DNA-binding response OmpR family regulator